MIFSVVDVDVNVNVRIGGAAQRPQWFGDRPQGFGNRPQGFGNRPQGFGNRPHQGRPDQDDHSSEQDEYHGGKGPRPDWGDYSSEEDGRPRPSRPETNESR